MLLNISISNFVFPDIIFDNLLITLHIKLNSLVYLFHVIYRGQIMYHICVNQLIIIYIILKYLSIKLTIRLIESLILSRLDYENIILIGAPIYIKKKIKRVIRRCIQIIFNIPYSNRFSTSYYLHKLK